MKFEKKHKISKRPAFVRLRRTSAGKEIGIVGLGKMGANLARRLMEKKWRVVGFNRTAADTKEMEKKGLTGAYSLKEVVEKLTSPRIIWVIVPAGKPTEDILDELAKYLEKGDILIDGGNSFYEDTIRRASKIERKGVHFLDVGTSGGPGGARTGPCLMIGGRKEVFRKIEPFFRELALPGSYGYFGKAGAGHFVKMVHNGIEYGMMQALAEGFAVMKKSPFKLDLKKVADVYNHRSVIESRLVGWLKDALEIFGEELNEVSGMVSHTGEGAWTVKTAKKLGVPVPIIKGAFDFRIKSVKNPSYTGKILSALRNQFGGHSINDKRPRPTSPSTKSMAGGRTITDKRQSKKGRK